MAKYVILIKKLLKIIFNNSLNETVPNDNTGME